LCKNVKLFFLKLILNKGGVMTEKQVEEQKEDVIVVGEGPNTWLALEGGTVVHGTHLVSDKLVGIVNEILKLDRGGVNFGIHCVEFKDNGMPAGKVGMSYIDSGSIAINLEEIWSGALSGLESGEVKLSITGVVWHELIMTLLHETHHIFTMQDAGYREIAKEDPKAAEKEAEDWAKDNMIEMSKTLDIEPSSFADMQFFNVKLMELMTTMTDEEWIVRAKLMLEEGIMYYDGDNDITLTSFREYLRGIEDPDEKDKDWEQGVSVIDLIFKMDDGSVVKTAEVLPEPVVDAEVAAADIAEQVIAGAGGVVETSVEKTELGYPAEDLERINKPAEAETPIAASPAQALFAPAPTEETVAAGLAEEATDTVQLPEAIVAEQAQVAAAAVAQPATMVPATSYEPHNLSVETIKAFLTDVYMRLYSHIFNKCGWQLNSDQGFTNPGAVLEPVSIADLIQLHNAPGLIKEYDSLNATGNLKPEECEGHIRGLVFTKSNQYGIPAYAIYLNLSGMRVKRSIISQNPAKRNVAGQYSPMALEARAGHAIAWIMSEDENKKFVAKIRDNVYEAL
jgi:hypothetical protein